MRGPWRLSHQARTSAALGCVFAVLLASTARARTAALDFDAAAAEAVGLLQDYIRVDTTNPPGHERRAADFLKAVFDREGIECEIYDQGGDRADIVARIPGTGKRRPFVLLSHMDVVPADAERWTVPPFSGEIRDGYIWGRGATDMKGTAICHLMTMLMLKRSGAVLDRDVVFLGTADEEEGSVDGVDWMIAHHKDALRNAEFAMTEGSYIDASVEGNATAWNVDVTEKSVLWLHVTAKGEAGHASIPEPNGAVARLVRAVNRILAYEPPIRLIPAVDSYFRSLAATAPPRFRADLANPAAAIRRPASRKRLTSDPFWNACLRPTISVTGLKGSDKVNVIPGAATATLDCRLLPGDDPAAFLKRLKAVAGDASLEWEVIASGVATASPIDTTSFERFDARGIVSTPACPF